MDIGITMTIATTTITALVAIMTWRQWVTNRARLQHELFDRRYKIYEKIAEFIAEMLRTGRVQPGRELQFLRETKHAYFAFGGDRKLKELVSAIYNHAVELHSLVSVESSLTGDELKKNVDQQRKIKDWLSQTLSDMESTFEKYFKLKH